MPAAQCALQSREGCTESLRTTTGQQQREREREGQREGEREGWKEGERERGGEGGKREREELYANATLYVSSALQTLDS